MAILTQGNISDQGTLPMAKPLVADVAPASLCPYESNSEI